MYELHSVRFIKKYGLGKLLDRFKLKAKEHQKYGNLIQLSYSQLQSPFETPEVQECRNLILDKSRDYLPVAWGFKKFFNYGESNAIDIDWGKEISVFEKIDGSIMVLYYYDDSWQLSSSSLPDARGSAPGKSRTFCEIFWSTWEKMKYKLPDDTSLCYTFELFTKDNVIIVQEHAEGDCIILLGVRSMVTLKEIKPEVIGEKCGYKVAPNFPELSKSLDSVIEKAKTLDPMKHEGFVVSQTENQEDGSFKRIKVKSPSYVAVHQLRVNDGKYPEKTKQMNRRRLLKVLVTNEHEEFLTYFPKFRNTFIGLKKQFSTIKEILVSHFDDFQSEKREEFEKSSENSTEKDVNVDTQSENSEIQKFRNYLRQGRTFASYSSSLISRIIRFYPENSKSDIELLQKFFGYKTFYLPVFVNKEETFAEKMSTKDIKSVENIFSIFKKQKFISSEEEKEFDIDSFLGRASQKKKEKIVDLRNKRSKNIQIFAKYENRLKQKFYDGVEFTNIFDHQKMKEEEEEEEDGEVILDEIGNYYEDQDKLEQFDDTMEYSGHCMYGGFYETQIEELIRAKKMDLDKLKVRDYIVKNIKQQFTKFYAEERKQLGDEVEGEKDDNTKITYEFEITPLGSTATNTALGTSDFDFFLKFIPIGKDGPLDENCDLPKRDGETEKKVIQVLKKSGYKDISSSITSNRVFLFKFRDNKFKHCRIDLTIFNPNCMKKTKYVLSNVFEDDRFQKLTIFVKWFLKIRNIGDSGKSFLNSFAVTLMIIMFLQNRDPPVLSYPISTIKKKTSGSENRESLSLLIHDFFNYYGNEFDYGQFAISTKRKTRPIHVNKLPEKLRNSKSPKHIIIEDPFEEDQNCARTVSLKSKEKMIFEFRRFVEMFEKKESLYKICSVPLKKKNNKNKGSTSHQKKKRRKNRKKKGRRK